MHLGVGVSAPEYARRHTIAHQGQKGRKGDILLFRSLAGPVEGARPALDVVRLAPLADAAAASQWRLAI
jgi:hypothetical protein